jgi:hypothetical protein
MPQTEGHGGARRGGGRKPAKGRSESYQNLRRRANDLWRRARHAGDEDAAREATRIEQVLIQFDEAKLQNIDTRAQILNHYVVHMPPPIESLDEWTKLHALPSPEKTSPPKP